MVFAISIVPLFIFVLLESVLLKSAALVSRTVLFWRYCFRYGGLIAILSIGVHSIILFLKYAPPFVLALLIGAVIHLVLGTWYVASFGQSKDGNPASVARAIVTMLIFLLLLSLLFSGFMLWATVSTSSIPQ
jgi:hypothetical protein